MGSVHRHRVRYHEVDRQGYLFNGRFLEIADTAMVEYFRHLGWTYDELIAGGTDPSVVQASVDFVSPARFDDELEAVTRCWRVGRSSFDLRTVVTRDRLPVASIAIVYVNVDIERNTSRPLPDDVADALRGDLDALAASATGSAEES